MGADVIQNYVSIYILDGFLSNRPDTPLGYVGLHSPSLTVQDVCMFGLERQRERASMIKVELVFYIRLRTCTR